MSGKYNPPNKAKLLAQNSRISSTVELMVAATEAQLPLTLATRNLPMDSTEHAANSVKNGAAAVGRPTKFSSSVVDALCEALGDGMPIKGACVVAGISVTTLAEWREKYPQIEQLMNEAREHARQKALQRIKSAGEKDWRAEAEWLRLSFPADYRVSGNKIEVSATASASAAVVTEEQRMALIERRKRLSEQRARLLGE